MEADLFDEAAFFKAIARSGARALLIGRRALIALGIPVLGARTKDAEDIRLLEEMLRGSDE